MKRFYILFFLIPLLAINAQKIGEMAPEKPMEQFPDNSWGIDVLIGEGGFGLGTFFRNSFNSNLTGFVDFSISESKDEREFEYIDYYGRSFVAGKKNRVFFMPLNFGMQYRLFSKTVTDNLRPYINAGLGPTFLATSPYEKEFFESFGKARLHYAAGGYVGFGANFGISKTNLIGLNFRYYYSKVFGDGIENLYGQYRKTISSFYITLNIGSMY